MDLYGLETVTIVMDGLDIGTTTLGEPEDMQLVITESHPPQSMQTSGNGSSDNSQGDSGSSGLHFWQRIKNCFSGFCGLDNAEKAAIQKAVDTQIQNERRAVERACEQGCFGKNASDIKKLSPQEVDRFYEALQFAAQFNAMFYGGRVTIDPNQLQSKFKHAEDFGVKGTYSADNALEFERALEQHLTDPSTQLVRGTYRGDPANIYVNSGTGNAVVTDPSGNFISGWRLSPAQMNYVTTTGNLN